MKNIILRVVNKKAFSLVELIIAVALLAIMVPSIFYALQTSMNINVYSDDQSDANYLAQSELENISVLSEDNTLDAIMTSTLSYSTSCASGIAYCTTKNNALYELSHRPLASNANMDGILLHVQKDGVDVYLELYLRFDN